MSDDKNSGVDPRFDAAFQRGFDPTAPIEEYVPPQRPRKATPPSSDPVGSAATASPEKPLARPIPVPAPAAAAGVVDGSVNADDAGAAESEADVDANADAEADANPARNPFLLFLGIIAVALVAAGIWLFVRSGEAFNSAEVRSQGDYMSLDATIHSAPFIALLGGATAIGILFVFAAKYRRR